MIWPSTLVGDRNTPPGEIAGTKTDRRTEVLNKRQKRNSAPELRTYILTTEIQREAKRLNARPTSIPWRLRARPSGVACNEGPIYSITTATLLHTYLGIGSSAYFFWKKTPLKQFLSYRKIKPCYFCRRHTGTRPLRDRNRPQALKIIGGFLLCGMRCLWARERLARNRIDGNV